MSFPSTAGRSALLLMDFYPSTVGRLPPEQAEQLLASTLRARDAARAAGVKVIYVVPNFRPGCPELANRPPESIRGAEKFAGRDPVTTIHPRLAAEPGDLVVRKFRYSPFWNTDLELLLRAQAIDTLVLAGIATSGVVLSALRDADDRAYRVYVLRDCCADFDAEIQRVLLDKLFPMQASVLTAEAWTASIAA